MMGCMSHIESTSSMLKRTVQREGDMILSNATFNSMFTLLSLLKYELLCSKKTLNTDFDLFDQTLS